ncbi:hypothetical protein [Aliidiomarina indica]|uniref:hypothetical protein n=1 Tax=Aliidiomarina indica TaxID=2749147 RepID=UPI00188F4BF0|nr:hypothetical protein [Aliidiomarina indica]
MGSLRQKISVMLLLFASFTASAMYDDFHPVVAEYIGHEMLPCENSDDLIYCVNEIYNYRFRIVESHTPELTVGNEINALYTSSHHYPAFMEERFSYFMLVRDNEHWIIDDFLWSFAYRTSDNRFAECGCSLLEGRTDEALDILCELATFQPRIQIDITHASSFGREKYETSDAWTVIGNTALCTRGIFTENLPKLFL